MRAVLIIVLSLRFGAFAWSAPLEHGASKEEVYQVMGAPDGMLELPSRTVLFYETAELTLVEGKLTDAIWRSVEEVAAKKAMEAKLRADWEEEQAQQAEARRQQGEAILLARRSNPAFKSLPPAQRLRAWSDFIRDYPGVDATAEYAQALEDVRALAEAPLPPVTEVARSDRGSDWSQTSLIDTTMVEPDYGGWNYMGPSVAVGNNAVVVVGGNGGFGYGYCTPAQSRPILSVSYQSDKIGVRYNSGSTTPLPRKTFLPPRQPVVIIRDVK